MQNDTIAAISTPLGKGGVAVIRMSGKGSFNIAEKVFLPKGKRSIFDYPRRTQIYGDILSGEDRIDDGMLTLFNEGNSYTGEESVEISCHGGVLVTRTVLESLFSLGATPAAAGEFTERAFLNGKLSLTEAEAIGNLLEAKSLEQIKLASSVARERLNKDISKIREDLTSLLSSIYSRIDYPDEDLGDFTDAETERELSSINEELTQLIATYKTGRAINEGINAVICGKPNAGKSTLYNLICGEDAAIVTDIEGTTRDLIEKTLTLGRVTLRLTDTAGIRDKSEADTVEKIGIERSAKRIQTSELIIAVYDLSRPFDDKDKELTELIVNSPASKICVYNKSDIELKEWDGYAILKGISFDREVKLSALNADNTTSLYELERAVDALFTDEKISCGTDAIVSSARQHGALVAAKGFIDTAIEGYKLGLPTDAASSDIEMALGAIGELDGRSVSEAVVSDIFSKFCVGK